MLDFHLENSNSKLKKLQGILQKNMLGPLLFLNFFGSWNKEVKYSRHYMLDFPLLWVVTYAEYYLSMKDK